MLICPSFFDGRLDGIGRVSGAFHQAMTRMNGCAPFVVSSNDAPGACPPDSGRCFGRHYRRLLWEALFLADERAKAGESRRAPASGQSARPIVCTHLGLSPAARLAAFSSGRPYVVFLHGIEAWRPLPWRSRWAVAGADRLLFNSDYTRNNFLRFNTWAAGLPATVVPLGMALPESRSASGGEAERLPVSPDGSNRPASARGERFRILIVGRMTRAEHCEGFRDATDLYKGFKPLIMAVGLLARAVPGVRLRIAGDGDARADLEAWLAGRSEREFVDFLGRVSDERLEQLYREADVFALPSEEEGFGLVFVEAMAHGVPCVGVRAGATPEVVTDGETGLIAEPRDVADLADKLLVLARNPAIRTRLGAAARQTYADKFTAAAFEDRIIAALRAVPSRR